MTRSATHAARVTSVTRALEANRSALVAFVRARGVAAAEVDDLLQIASMRAIERAELLDDPDRVLAWLYRIVRNVIVDEARATASRARRTETFAALPETADRFPDDEPCRCSATLARELPPRYATVLTLVDLGEASLAEAASVLGISTNNATVRLHRARKALRHKLREHCGVSSSRDCRDCRCAYEGCCT